MAPTDDTPLVTDGDPGTAVCDICGERRANVEPRDLAPWPATAVETCPVCAHVFATDTRDGCLRCDEPIDAPRYVELEAPTGDVPTPATLSGTLCTDCSQRVLDVLLGSVDVPLEASIAAEPDADQRDALRDALATEEVSE